ncbi:MAG: LCP family protein [Actinomycetota bacterium]
MALLATLVLVPHLAVGWMGWSARSTLLAVFEPAPVEPDPTALAPRSSTTTLPTRLSTTTTTITTTITTSTSTTTTVPTLTPGAASPAPPETFTPPTRPPTTTTTLPFGDDRLEVLILGGDAGPGRSGLRTDTIMVASVDPATGDAALFGLPRNFGGLTFPDGSRFRGGILNEVYAYGRNRPDRFPGEDPGAVATRTMAEHLTGLSIDHYLLVDLTGFGALIDAFGGVTVTVPSPVDGPLYDPDTGDYEMIRIEAGEQTLNGGQALAYARSRLGTSDYSRMHRQRCLLTAMVDGANPVRLLANLSGLLESVETHVTTDLPLELVPDLIRLTERVSAPDVRVIGFGPEWSKGRNRSGYPVPDIGRIREAVHRTVTDPGSAEAVPAAAEACG